MATQLKTGGLVVMLSLMCYLPSQVQAQENQDSIRMVVLEEVWISGKKKDQQQHLYHYFIANKAATTEDILSRLPELSLVRRGSYGMEPVIRGFGAQQVNVLVDGMKIHGACTDRMDPATIYIEPDNLQSMQVQTGTSSLLDGASIGGNLDMKLAEAEVYTGEKRWTGKMSSGWQSAAEAWLLSGNFNYAGDRFGIRASGTYRNAQPYRAGGGGKVNYSQYEKINYSINGKYQLGESWMIKANMLADDGWNIGYPALPMDVGYASARIGSVALVHENGKGRWQQAAFKVYANKVKHFMDDTHRKDIPMHMDMPGLSVTTGAIAEGRLRLRGRNQLLLRADGSTTLLKASMTMYQDGQPPMYMLTWPDNRNMQTSVAAKYLLQIDSSNNLALSARAALSDYRITSQMGKDQMKVFGYDNHHRVILLPALSGQYSRKLGSKLLATVSVTFNGRAPSASELYGFYLFSQFDGYDYIGNIELDAERSLQGELGLTWQQPGVRLHLSGYYSRVQNYIMGITDPSLQVMTIGAHGVKQYRNTGTATIAGGEASGLLKPLKGMELVSTLKYSYGENESGYPLPLIAPLRNITSLRQAFGQLALQAELETASRQLRVSDAAGERPTGAFSLWHFRVGYQRWINQVLWRLDGGVENILDARYREHLDWGMIPRAGRNIYLQMSIGLQ